MPNISLETIPLRFAVHVKYNCCASVRLTHKVRTYKEYHSVALRRNWDSPPTPHPQASVQWWARFIKKGSIRAIPTLYSLRKVSMKRFCRFKTPHFKAMKRLCCFKTLNFKAMKRLCRFIALHFKEMKRLCCLKTIHFKAMKRLCRIKTFI